MPRERSPILVINYKTYATGVGRSGLQIALEAEKAAAEYGVEVMVAVPCTMIPVVAQSVKIPVLAQHVDSIEPGRGTGYVTAEALKAAGARGSLVNHSERRLTLSDIQAAIALLKAHGLLSVACGDTPEAAASVGLLGADVIAVEPPELIGTGIPVSKARPEVVRSSVELVKERLGLGAPLLVGAGITNGDDARRSIELGADGVLVSSAVMKAPDPGSKIAELAEALSRASSEL